MQRRDDWNHYQYRYGDEETQAEVHFDVMSSIMPDEALPCTRVVGPAANEAAIIDALADVDGMLVGILRYAKQVELVIRGTAPTEPTAQAITDLGATCTTVDGGYFSERVSPSPSDWRRIADREALAKLDLDDDGEIRVLHQFFGADKGLDLVKEALKQEAFEQVDAGEGRLHLVSVHPVSELSVYTVGLLRLCERNQVVYDGWILPG